MNPIKVILDIITGKAIVVIKPKSIKGNEKKEGK